MSDEGTAGMQDDADWVDLRGPRSLYLHVPFCRHRCGYCNFTLVANRDHWMDRYIAAVLREMDLDPAVHSGSIPPLQTVYFGGGTPTHLAGRGLTQLVEGIRSRFTLTADAEFTVEANPEDLTPDVATQLAELGVNRVSLGVQSLNSRKLELLERSHDAARAAEAIRLCRQFARSVSLDLIFAAPGETVGEWEADLSAAMELAPDHLSAYELTWEKGTSFWSRLLKREMTEATEDQRQAMYELTVQLCGRSGLQQYEVSSFSASRAHRSRHNSVYWSGEPWLAFGPGAASLERSVRRIRHRSVVAYLRAVEAGQCSWETDAIPADARAMEILCIGLRRLDGVDREEFLRATGRGLAGFFPELQREAELAGLAVRTPGNLRLTRRGLALHDWIGARWTAAVVRPQGAEPAGFPRSGE